MNNKEAYLSKEEESRLSILNRSRKSKGLPEFKPKEYKLIVRLFSDKNGKLSGALLRVYEFAYKKYGEDLLKKRFKCSKCKEKKSFRYYKFKKDRGEFTVICRDCNPSQHTGYYYVDRRRKLKLLKKPSPRISYKQYRKEKAKYKDSADRYHPRFKNAVQTMLQVFGRKIFKKEKPCKICGDTFPLYKFTSNPKLIYIGNRCRQCESKRIAKYIRKRLEKKKKHIKNNQSNKINPKTKPNNVP